MTNYCIGNVLEINANKIKVIMHQKTNMFVYYVDGNQYMGVTIDEYVGIIRGPYKIVAQVEKESLVDNLKDEKNHTYSIDRFQRIIDVKPIGYYYKNKFIFGIKYLPMIYNEVVLLSEKEINEIFSTIIKSPGKEKDLIEITIGSSLKENFPIKLNIDNLFNTHIGIFGNTGSGKSNTLTKLYTELFKNSEIDVWTNSKFIILDFNGEYISENIFTNSKNKKIIRLSTHTKKGKDKIIISKKKFWTIEVLSTLFSATEKTQQPFLQNMLDFYDKDLIQSEQSDKNRELIKKILEVTTENLIKGNKKEMINIFKQMFLIVFNKDTIEECNFMKMKWHSKNSTIYVDDFYFNESDKCEDLRTKISDLISSNLKDVNLGIIDTLSILVYSQLIYGLRYDYVQFDHINPLIARISSYKSFIEKIIELKDNEEDFYKGLTIISFKDCNEDSKKIFPLLIAKDLYDTHIHNTKDSERIQKTTHLIIDEAHNILSESLSREAESFRDYRLDVFEKIIKEGRKFGFYLTISSQRPHDISPTIVSQIHNYFIHRLVNDLDLKMIANAISTLDTVSREKIPNFSSGECVLTGTSFEIPIIIKVDKLEDDLSPNSENADLSTLWKKEK